MQFVSNLAEISGKFLEISTNWPPKLFNYWNSFLSKSHCNQSSDWGKRKYTCYLKAYKCQRCEKLWLPVFNSKHFWNLHLPSESSSVFTLEVCWSSKFLKYIFRHQLISEIEWKVFKTLRSRHCIKNFTEHNVRLNLRTKLIFMPWSTYIFT